jgi:hypothetical protein
MADESKVDEVSSMADKLKLPPLVSSVYATPLFRRGLEPINLPGFGDVSNDQPGIFISDGFVFPPSEHENLPIEPDVNENDKGKENSCVDDEWCYVTPEEVDDISDEHQSVRGGLPSANGTAYPDSKTPEVHSKHVKDHITGNSDLPCEGWWKRKTTYIFHHIKGVTTVCSVVAAGAVVGFVVMGQRFHQDNWHFQQIHLSVSSEVCYQSLSEEGSI